MKWTASVGISLTIEYDDIEADSREEAEEIAKDLALEDIDYNNAELSDTTVYICYPTGEEDWEEDYE